MHRAATIGQNQPMKSPPPRPGRVEESLARFLLLAASPPLRYRAPAAPSANLGSGRPFCTAKRRGIGAIEGDLFRRSDETRGLVVFLPPWVPQGGSWFYRHGRVEAVVDAGYDALVVDLPGVRRGRRGPGFFDREIGALIADARDLARDAPLFLWGVSSGGYWAHFALSGGVLVDGAVFEDVAAHLLTWAHREAPQWAHFYRVFERFLTRAWPFLAVSAHAPTLGVGRGLWISGELDRGVLPEETRLVAQAAGGESMIIAGAGHLGAMRVAPARVLEAAIGLFEAGAAERGSAAVGCR